MQYSVIKTVLFALFSVFLSFPSSASVSLNLQLEGGSHAEVVRVKNQNLIGATPFSVILRARLVSNFTENVKTYFVLSISTSRNLLLCGQSRWFTLQPGALYLTNLDLTRIESDCRLTNAAISACTENILRGIEQHGFLPPDVYQLKLELYRAEDQTLLACDELHIEVKNPSAIDRIVSAGFRQLQVVTQRRSPYAARVADALQKILGYEYSNVKLDLAGYQPTSRLTLNGRTVSIGELEQLALRFEVKDCLIEDLSIR